MSHNTIHFHTSSAIHCWLNKVKFVSDLQRKEESVASGVRGLHQNCLSGETCLSFPVGVNVLLNDDWILKFLETSI